MHSLVTGGGGFVGQALSARLTQSLESGDRVTKRDITFEGIHPAGRGITVIKGSLAEQRVADAVVARGGERIFHIATLPGRGAEKDFSSGNSANLDATITLLEAVRLKAPGCRFVYASSVSVYGRRCLIS